MYSKALRDVCDDVLTQGRERLAMTMGIVSHISGDEYEIVAVSSSTGVFVAGESFALQDTYCRDVFESQQAMSMVELDGYKGLKKHPLYDTLPLEAYISVPIFLQEKVWGTINFSCMALREHSFTDADLAFMQTYAQHIGQLLEAGA